MNTKQIISIFALLIFQLPVALAQWDVRNYPGSNFDGPAFVFEEVAADIYQARGADNLMVGSNTAIIINDDDVVVIDSNISPVAAAALAEELKAITDKPIKTVINTHFHFDHAHGNQIYPAAVQIIGHEFTYEMLANGGSPVFYMIKTGRIRLLATLKYSLFAPHKADLPRSIDGAMMVRRLILHLIASSVFSAPPIELPAQF